MKSEKEILRDFFKNGSNFLAAGIGIITSLITLSITTKKISMWILGIIVIMAFLIIWFLIYKLLNLKFEPCIAPICWHTHTEHGNVLIIRKNDYLSANAYVTLYLNNNEVEEYYGTGIILYENTSKGNLMVGLLCISNFYKKNNPNETYPQPKEIKIKPILTNHFFEERNI